MFYMVCVLGIVAGILVIANPDRELKLFIALGMWTYLYIAIDLLWWFGDHPEE